MVLLRNVISWMALSPTKHRNRLGMALGACAQQRSNLAAVNVLLDFWRVIHYLLFYLRGNVYPAQETDPASAESQWQARTIWTSNGWKKTFSHRGGNSTAPPAPVARRRRGYRQHARTAD